MKKKLKKRLKKLEKKLADAQSRARAAAASAKERASAALSKAEQFLEKHRLLNVPRSSQKKELQSSCEAPCQGQMKPSAPRKRRTKK